MKVPIQFIFISLALFACNQASKPSENSGASNQKDSVYEVKTGGNKYILVENKYKVWTKKIGDGQIKVLLLHGGPGFSSIYFECFEDFLPKEGIEFYYYDQLGCGNSDIPSDTSLWTVSRYTEEVEQVRKALGLDNFYLLGHSWGGMLVMEYLQKYQSHVKGAIISNMTAGMKSFTSYTAQLKQKYFSPAEQKTFDSLDLLKQYSSAKYQELLMNNLYGRVICRLNPWPEFLIRGFSKVNESIYIQMQGVDEFHVTGNFKNWEMWDRLSNIKVPTLVIGGIYDEMNPEDIRKEGELIPNSRTYLCPNGSHMSMYDDQQNYFNSLIGFLKDVETNKWKKRLF
ncbi:MAG: proline iminopeptidase-family hydrolase [Bacteroidales bacterium]